VGAPAAHPRSRVKEPSHVEATGEGLRTVLPPRFRGALGPRPPAIRRTVANPDDQIIRTAAKSEAVTTLEKFDRIRKVIESLTAGAADWSVVGSAFSQTNAKLYLRFSAVQKGRKTFNVPAGGVVAFGSTPPPAHLYTGPTDRPIIRKMLAAGQSVIANPVCVALGDLNDGQDVIGSANVQLVTTPGYRLPPFQGCRVA